jgi:hypothetical protein
MVDALRFLANARNDKVFIILGREGEQGHFEQDLTDGKRILRNAPASLLSI